jgi:lipopolysaccharide export system ATP-binding protein
MSLTQNGGNGSRPDLGRARIAPPREAIRGVRAQPPEARPKIMQPQSTEGLVVEALAKSYKRRPVVRDVSLTLRRGEAVGLLGPNGAGKTTVFYMITGLLAADRGSIRLDGVDITHLPIYQRARLGIGYLPQESSIFRGLTVEENLRAVLELSEPDKSERQRVLRELFDEFQISHIRHSPAVALSGGERRRVEIARALATKPQFILLDEPFAGIDPIAIGDIRNLVRQLTARGIGVLITDHNVRETLDIIDRALIIHEGKVLTTGTPDEIVNNSDVRRYYLGEEFAL